MGCPCVATLGMGHPSQAGMGVVRRTTQSQLIHHLLDSLLAYKQTGALSAKARSKEAVDSEEGPPV